MINATHLTIVTYPSYDESSIEGDGIGVAHYALTLTVPATMYSPHCCFLPHSILPQRVKYTYKLNYPITMPNTRILLFTT